MSKRKLNDYPYYCFRESGKDRKCEPVKTFTEDWCILTVRLSQEFCGAVQSYGMNCYNLAHCFQYLPCKTGILLYNKYIFAKNLSKMKKVTFMKQFWIRAKREYSKIIDIGNWKIDYVSKEFGRTKECMIPNARNIPPISPCNNVVQKKTNRHTWDIT